MTDDTMDQLRRVHRLEAVGRGFTDLMSAINTLSKTVIAAYDALDGEPAQQVPLLLLGQRLNAMHEQVNAEARAWLERETA